MLGHLNFRLERWNGKEWEEAFDFKGPSWSGVAPAGEPRYRIIRYLPKKRRLKVTAIGGGCYIRIYQLWRTEKRAEMPLDQKRAKVIEELVRKLDSEEWREREAAEKSLKKEAPDALKLLRELFEAAESPEVKMRLKRVIEELTLKAQPPATKPVEESKIKKSVTELIPPLIELVRKQGYDSEPAKSLGLLPPFAVSDLAKRVDDKSADVRVALLTAVYALDKEKGRKQAIEFSKDSEEGVRLTAVRILANHLDDEAVRKRLGEMAENDPSEKVAVAAYNTLAKRKEKEEEK